MKGAALFSQKDAGIGHYQREPRVVDLRMAVDQRARASTGANILVVSLVSKQSGISDPGLTAITARCVGSRTAHIKNNVSSGVNV